MPKPDYTEVREFFTQLPPEERETYFQSLYDRNQREIMPLSVMEEYAAKNLYASSLAYSKLTLTELWEQELNNAEKTIEKETHDSNTLIDILVNNYPEIAERMLEEAGQEYFRTNDFDYRKGAPAGHTHYSYFMFIVDIDWSHLTIQVFG